MSLGRRSSVTGGCLVDTVIVFSLIAAALGVAALVYLVVALIRPERF